jgi:hypothetical protein
MDSQSTKDAPVSLAQNYDPKQGAKPDNPQPATQNVGQQQVSNQTPTQPASVPQAQNVPAQAAASQAQPNEKPAEASTNMEPLSGAPPAMTQKTPSNFQSDSENPKRKPKKGKMCCIAFIVVFLILILGVVGVGAYAYFTDTYIPVVSDVVDKIEALIKGPQETARDATEEVTATLIGTFLPLTGSDESLMATFAASSVSADYMNNLLETNQATDSARYDLELSVSAQEQGSETDMSLAMNGAVNNKDQDNPKMSGEMDVSISAQGVTMDAQGEMRLVGEKSYIKLDSYPEMLDMYIGDLTGKWIDLESESVQETATMVTGEEEQIDKQEVSEEDIDNLMELVTDDSVVKNAEFLPGENIEGNDCNCMKLSWSQDELKDVVKKYDEIYGYEYDEEEVSEAVKDIEKVEMESCLGKESKMVHRIGMKMTMDNGELQLNLKMWDYGADMTIEEPTDAVTMEEALADSPVMTTAKDYEVQADMMAVQLAVETYYSENMEYPESLNNIETSIKTEIYGEKVHYKRTDEGYELWITLPSGEKYDLSNE